jgi:hypothetical protein
LIFTQLTPKRKKFLIGFFGSFFILGALVFIFIYKWKNPKADNTFVCPSGAEIVGVCNTHVLFEDFFKYGIKGYKDTGDYKHILRESGIDYLAPIWVFASVKDSFAGISAIVSDEKKLVIFLEKTVGLLANKNIENYWKNDKYSAQIKGRFVYFFVKGTAKIPEMNGGNFAGQMPFLTANMSNTLLRLAVDRRLALFDKFSALLGQDSMLQLEVKENSNELLISLNGMKQWSSNSDTSAPFSVTIPQEIFGSYPKEKQRSMVFLKKMGLDTTGILSMNGIFSFAWQGTGKKQDKKISYIFDEEFNRKEVITITEKNIPLVEAFWQPVSNEWFAKTRSDSIVNVDVVKMVNIFGLPVYLRSSNKLAMVSTLHFPDRRKCKDYVCATVNFPAVKKHAKMIGLQLPVEIPVNLDKIWVNSDLLVMKVHILYNHTDRSPIMQTADIVLGLIKK